MQLTTKKKNIKVAKMTARVNDLYGELQAAQMGSAGLLCCCCYELLLLLLRYCVAAIVLLLLCKFETIVS
jgi:hypothetical protein